MEMDERGLGTGALVGIVVAVVVVVAAVVGVILLAGGGGAVGPGGIAVYPGSEEFTGMTLEQAMSMSGEQLPASWSGKIYTTSDSASTVANWYRTQMAGWTKVMDNTMDLSQYGGEGTVVVLAYMKGNDGALIATYDITGYGTMFMLLSGPAADLIENMT